MGPRKSSLDSTDLIYGQTELQSAHPDCEPEHSIERGRGQRLEEVQTPFFEAAKISRVLAMPEHAAAKMLKKRPDLAQKRDRDRPPLSAFRMPRDLDRDAGYRSVNLNKGRA